MASDAAAIIPTQAAVDVVHDAMAAKKGTELPSYIYEGVEKTGKNKGEPDGTYHIDYMKYSTVLSEQFSVHNFMNQLYIFDPSTGVYKPNVNLIETSIRDTIKKYNVSDRLTSVNRETMEHLKCMGCSDNYPFIGTFGTIHVKNGSLNLETGKITPSTPNKMYDYRIETEYKPLCPDYDSVSIIGDNFGVIKTPVVETPELYTFLDQYGTREPIDVLAKAIWQRAYHDTLKELTIFYGPKDSGKTTCSELIQATLDGDLTKRNNTSRTLLHELLQRFGYADLESKLLNYGDDLPDMFIKNSGRLNTLVGSVVQHIEKKGKDGYSTTITAYYLFSCNNLPPLDDDDAVIWAKIHLVEFEKVISAARIPRDTLFTQTIKEQLLFRAIQKAIGWRKKPYVNPQTADEVRVKWHESSTDVEAFMLEALTYDPGGQLSLEQIKKHYEAWCVANNKKKHMKYLTKNLRPGFRHTDMGNVYAYRLIGLKKPEAPQTAIFKSN